MAKKEKQICNLEVGVIASQGGNDYGEQQQRRTRNAVS